MSLMGLTQPGIGTTDWGVSVNQNFQDIQDALAGGQPSFDLVVNGNAKIDMKVYDTVKGTWDSSGLALNGNWIMSAGGVHVNDGAEVGVSAGVRFTFDNTGSEIETNCKLAMGGDLDLLSGYSVINAAGIYVGDGAYVGYSGGVHFTFDNTGSEIETNCKLNMSGNSIDLGSGSLYVNQAGGSTAKIEGYYGNDFYFYATASPAFIFSGGNIEVQENLRIAGNSWLGMGSSAGRFVFNSTPTPDTITLTSADFMFGSSKLDTSGQITMADDAWIGLGASAGRLVFDSTATPDTITVTGAFFCLNGNTLYFDAAKTANMYWTGVNVQIGPGSHLEVVGDIGLYGAGTIKSTNLTASRLLATNASSDFVASDLFGWVAGTANRITVTDDGDGTITLSTPQDIATSSSPTFAGATLTGNLLIGANAIGNSAGVLSFASGAAGEATFAGDVDLASGKVYRVNNTQVVGAQQAHIADASVSYDVSGNDRVSQAAVESALSALGTKINSILSMVETHGLTAAS